MKLVTVAGAFKHEHYCVAFMENGEIDDTQLTDWLDERCKLFAFSQGSNVLATTIPVEKWLRKAKAAG